LFRNLGLLKPGTPSVVVNGSGVDIQEYGHAGLPEGPVVFLMIARLLVAKGVREYVQAAKHLRAEFPSARFLLAGWLDEGPDSVGAKELAAWEDEGAVEYLGRLADVKPALRGCSAYILPSYREGTPRTVLEAMSIGRAIITTDAPGCRETVIDGHNGYLVPVRSVQPLSDAIRRLLDSPEDLKRMGDASRRLAEEKYDVKKVNAVMLREMGIRS
jgi:glycosyltransferase involved in cell wall biosynthesis